MLHTLITMTHRLPLQRVRGRHMTEVGTKPGSAERWGPLWGARPNDWALSEDQQIPSYEEALGRAGLEPGQLVLDIGCGAGAFLRLVANWDARPFGLDA